MTAAKTTAGDAACGIEEALASLLRSGPVPGERGAIALSRAGADVAWPPCAAPLPSVVRRAAEVALVGGRDVPVADGPRTWLTAGRSDPFPVLVAVCAEEIDDPQRLAPALSLAAGLAATRLMPSELARDPFLGAVAASPSLAPVAATLRRLAPTRLPVLLLGETGTGKEVFARALHRSSRRRGPFVAENCAALPESLLEAELFGVCRGAFTGATADRPGRIAEANGGTLLLDEVGDLPLALQAKLLRVLQEREVRSLGGDRVRPVDARIVAATHRELEDSAAFRRDLYYRLAGLVVRIPALRERRGDVPYLVAAILARAAAEGIGPGRHVSKAGLAVLGESFFPGNVRELENLLHRAAALSPGALIPAESLRTAPPVREPSREAPAAANLEVRAILQALTLGDGVKAEAARHLGWSRQKLYRRLEALGLR